MNQSEVEFLIGNLSWNATQRDRDEAIAKLRSIDDDHLPDLILPGVDKSIWEGAALVIQKIGCPRILPLLPKLLVWLQDLNWPGSRVILETLLEIDKDQILPPVRDAIAQAYKEGDEDWLLWLKLFIVRKGIPLSEVGSEEIVRALQNIEL